MRNNLYIYEYSVILCNNLILQVRYVCTYANRYGVHERFLSAQCFPSKGLFTVSVSDSVFAFDA